MSRKPIRPSTLDGIKRLASSLKADQQIPHARALDLAAQSAGFQNFIHAGHVLRNALGTELKPSGHLVYLTAYWKDRKSDSSGRETLTIRLTKPWTDLITPALLRNHHALAHFRAEGPDHLSREFLVKTQPEARRAVCAAARAFQFMDATKLRPSRSFSRVYPGGDSRNAIPGRDHFSIWYDRTTKRYLFVDEPYESSVQDRLNERDAWAKQHGFAIVKPQWPGMYAPDIGSRLYLIAHQTKGIPLTPIAAILNKLPKPIVEERWNGESAPMMPYFVSPGSVAKAAISKAIVVLVNRQNSRVNGRMRNNCVNDFLLDARIASYVDTLARILNNEAYVGQQTLSVNLLAPFWLTLAFADELQANHGSMLAISSIHEKLTKPGFVAYAIDAISTQAY